MSSPSFYKQLVILHNSFTEDLTVLYHVIVPGTCRKKGPKGELHVKESTDSCVSVSLRPPEGSRGTLLPRDAG